MIPRMRTHRRHIKVKNFASTMACADIPRTVHYPKSTSQTDKTAERKIFPEKEKVN